MASIKMKENHEFDGKKLFHHVVGYLPSYARPRFLRIQVRVEFHNPLSWRLLSLREQLPSTMVTILARFSLHLSGSSTKKQKYQKIELAEAKS